MVSNQYALLFSVEINHSYYKDGICRGLQCIPSAKTQNLIAKYALLIRNTPNGFSFYASTDKEVKDFINGIKTTEEEISFSFDVMSSDPGFTSFTDYPISEIGVFSFHTPTEGDTTTLERKFIPDITNTISFSITIDFDAIIRFRESGNNPNYKVELASRKTQWRYYIINSSGQQFEKLEIKGDSGIPFGEGTEVTLQNGQKALLFSSGASKLPISEKELYTFNLISTKTILGNRREQTIAPKLPNAGTTIEMYIEDNTKQVASPMYIYI